VRELAAAARRAGVRHVEHVRALAGDSQERARIVRVDRREFRTQRSACVGVALRCGVPQKCIQARRADEIECRRGDWPEVDRFERELAERSQPSPSERSVVNEQQRIDCDLGFVGRKRAAAQDAAQRRAGVDRVHERQQV